LPQFQEKSTLSSVHRGLEDNETKCADTARPVKADVRAVSPPHRQSVAGFSRNWGIHVGPLQMGGDLAVARVKWCRIGERSARAGVATDKFTVVLEKLCRARRD